MARHYETHRRRLYRDPEHGWIAGVCAGLARFFGVGRFCVRLVALVSFLLLTVPTLIVYGILWLVLDRAPKERNGCDRRRRSGLSERLEALDRRIRDIETHVTSREYDLEREFRRL